MNKIYLAAGFAALALAAPLAAPAQQLPAATIGVVDTDRIIRECTVCVAANTVLQGQVQQLQTRAQQLGAPLQTEGQAIETALRALPQGQQPNAALSQRIQTFQTNQQNAQQEVQTRQQQLERNVGFVRQQIAQRIQPAIQQIMQQRSATVILDRGATLAAAPSIDLTAAVLAIVNQNNAPLNVNAPPPQQQPAARPAASGAQPATPAAQPPRRPQGR